MALTDSPLTKYKEASLLEFFHIAIPCMVVLLSGALMNMAQLINRQL